MSPRMRHLLIAATVTLLVCGTVLALVMLITYGFDWFYQEPFPPFRGQ